MVNETEIRLREKAIEFFEKKAAERKEIQRKKNRAKAELKLNALKEILNVRFNLIINEAFKNRVWDLPETEDNKMMKDLVNTAIQVLKPSKGEKNDSTRQSKIFI
jgi:vacuolar-type H+-ATPase subunit E/Vma4